MVGRNRGSALRRGVAAVGGLVAIIASLALGVPAQPAGATTAASAAKGPAVPELQCDVPITTNVKLSADLTCPDPIRIDRGTPPVTIDLGGHTLTGPKSGCSWQNSISCTVAGQDTGASIINGTVDGNVGEMRISHVHVTGIVTTGMTGSISLDRSVVDHGVYQYGFGSIRNSRITGGIMVDDVFIGKQVSIIGTTIVGGFGISVSMGFPGDLGGIVSGNDVSGSTGAGIALQGPATETLRPISITGNTVHDNAGDGIGVTVASNDYFVLPGGDNGPIELRGNVARRNGGRGINAAFSRDGGSGPGVIDRGANRASGNAVAPQCVGVRCEPTDTRLIPDVTWHNPAQLDSHVPLSSTQLNATSPIPGTFTYSPAVGTVPLGGPTALRVHFVPDDLVHYQPTDRTVELLVPVSPVVPTITWPAPDPIGFGTPLGSVQLDATAPVPGTFTYTPPAGTVLTVGSHQLHVRFVPDDRFLYLPTGVDVTITVLPPAAESVTWADPAAIPYGTPLGSGQQNAVASVPGTIVYTPSLGTVLMPGPHALVADFTPDDTTSYSPIQTVVQIEVLPPTDPPPTATFAPALDVPRSGYNTPIDVDLADLNGDNAVDVVTAMPGLFSIPGNVRISFGSGDGSFPTSTDVIIPLGPGGHTVATGDVNGDGAVDLVATNAATSTISILLGNGDGTFGAPVERAAGNGQGDVQLVDMDGDGHLDVVESNYVGGTVSVLLGNGDGTFADKIDTRAGAMPVKLAAADVNGDHKLDLVVPDALTNIVSVLLGNGDGTFQPRRAIPVGLTPTSVAATDLDGDGHLDLAVTNVGDSTLSVLTGDGTGGFGSRLDYSSATGPRAVRAGDVNGDGIVDLVTANDSGSIGVWLGVGDGTLHPRIDREIGPAGSALALGDLDGDHQLDVVVARPFQLQVTVILNRTLTPAP